MKTQSKSYQKIKASIPSKRSKSLKKAAPIDIDLQDFDNIGEARYPLKELKIAHDGFGPNSLPPREMEIDPKAFVYREESKSKAKTPKRIKQKKSKSQVPVEFKPPSGAFQCSDEENYQPENAKSYLSERKKKGKKGKSQKQNLSKSVKKGAKGKAAAKKKLQMQCCHCRGIMGYDIGGIMVKCPYCETTNYTVPVGIFECLKCKTKGVRPDGVEYVECVCGTLNHLPSQLNQK